METVRCGEIEFPARDAGPCRGDPTLLFLHGLGDRGATFDVLIRDLRLARFRMLVPDLPGYGASAKPASPLPLTRLADILAAWLGEACKGPVVLVGHSMGGTLAQLIAERHPALVKGLMNVEGNICLDDCTVSGCVARQALEEFLSPGFSRLVATMERAGRKDAATRTYAASLKICDPASLHLHSTELVELSRPGDLARRMAALPVSVRYVAASPGGAGVSALALLKAAGVPTTVLSPSGHSPQFDQPDALVAALVKFLAGPH